MNTDMELLRCYIPKRTADFIRHTATYYHVSIGQCIEQLIDSGCIDRPAVAAAYTSMSLMHSIKTQNSEEQTLTMLMLIGEVMRIVMARNGWTFAETAAEAEKNFDAVQNLLKEDDEEEEKEEE